MWRGGHVKVLQTTAGVALIPMARKVLRFATGAVL
jgi:hypothetical protein